MTDMHAMVRTISRPALLLLTDFAVLATSRLPASTEVNALSAITTFGGGVLYYPSFHSCIVIEQQNYKIHGKFQKLVLSTPESVG